MTGQVNPLLGVLLHAMGGLAAASFYIPLKKVKNWSWESFWLVQGIAAWIIAPIVMARVTIPDLWGVYSISPPDAMIKAYVFGALWGIGGLTFGLSMRYLGMSLGYALALGFCAAFGTMVPAFTSGKADDLFHKTSGHFVLMGVAVCLAGIAVCCFAGTLKEKEMTAEEKRAAIAEFALTKGFLVAVFAGIMSSCMALALSAGKPIADNAISMNAEPIFSNNATLVIILAGGMTSNLLWCLYLNIRNKTFRDYAKAPWLANVALCAGGGITWYLQFFFYGMGTTKMGHYDFASWTIHMAFIILFSNIWGLIFREWKGSSQRTLSFVYAGLLVLLLSTMVVGYGNYRGKLESDTPKALMAKPVHKS